MRTIGVLGGIGPQATIDFETRLHAAAQRVVPQHVNQGYPPMITLYLRHAPIELGPDDRPRQPLRLDPRVPEAARRLGGQVDLLVIPCNTPHLFLPEIREAAGCEVLSIVDVTIDELRRRDARPVGLLGLGIPQVHAERLRREGFETLLAPPELRDALDDAILRFMEGAATEAHREAARRAVASVREQRARVTVLGCTEIPLLLGAEAEAEDLVNPAELLAREAVLRAV